MYHPFSIRETFKSSWNILKENFSVIIVYSVVSFIVIMLLAFLIWYFSDYAWIAGGGVFLLLIIISYNFLGFIKLILRLMDKEYYEFDFSDIIPKVRMVASYLLLLIIVSTLTVLITNAVQALNAGITQDVLGIVTGYFFQFFFVFYFPLCTCFIVDDQSGPFESVAQSFNLIRGNFIKYLGLFIIIEILIFLLSLTIIGTVLVIPFVNILLTVTYRKLVYSHMDVDDDVAETN